MSDRTWKAFERRCARLLGTERIPVTGERHGADAETPRLALQFKKRRTVPGYLLGWVDGIRGTAQRRGKVGVVVMQLPRRRDCDALVVLTLADFIELQGSARSEGEP